MKSAVLLLGLILLAGCQQKPDLSVTRGDLQIACEVATLADAIYEARFAAKDNPDRRTKIRATYASISAVCQNLPSNTGEDILAAITAMNTFTAEVNAAKQ